MFIDRFFKAIIINEKVSSYPLTIFILNLIFCYIFFGTVLKYDKLILLSILSTFSISSFIGIFTKISYRQIRDYYPEWAKTAMRIFIFIFLLGLLLYHIDEYKLFDSLNKEYKNNIVIEIKKGK
jgi:hypothetical protein